MDRKLGILVGASLLGSERGELEELIKNKDVYKVAVDGGISFFQECGIRPDFWIGDMDSYEEISAHKNLKSDNSSRDFYNGIETKILPHIKDDTDMAAAVEQAFANGCDEVFIYGGVGGERMAHTFANVQLMLHYAKLRKKIMMVSERDCMFVLYEDKAELPAREGGYLSVFALTDVAYGVEIKGLFYEYQGNLTNDIALGVSNEFCGKPAEISVQKGALLIVYGRNGNAVMKNV